MQTIIAPAPGILASWHGKCSTFGGPSDLGMRADEGLALYDELGTATAIGLFLPGYPEHASAYGRRLDPRAFYVACRWDYSLTGRALLQASWCRVTCLGRTAFARPVDWGPNQRTGRVADLSPGLARYLGASTDQAVTVELLK